MVSKEDVRELKRGELEKLTLQKVGFLKISCRGTGPSAWKKYEEDVKGRVKNAGGEVYRMVDKSEHAEHHSSAGRVGEYTSFSIVYGVPVKG